MRNLLLTENYSSSIKNASSVSFFLSCFLKSVSLVEIPILILLKKKKKKRERREREEREREEEEREREKREREREKKRTGGAFEGRAGSREARRRSKHNQTDTHTYTPHTETHKRARVYFSSPFPLVFPSLFLPQLLRASTLRELFLIPLSLLLIRCWIEKREREERERERESNVTFRRRAAPGTRRQRSSLHFTSWAVCSSSILTDLGYTAAATAGATRATTTR